MSRLARWWRAQAPSLKVRLDESWPNGGSKRHEPLRIWPKDSITVTDGTGKRFATVSYPTTRDLRLTIFTDDNGDE